MGYRMGEGMEELIVDQVQAWAKTRGEPAASHENIVTALNRINDGDVSIDNTKFIEEVNRVATEIESESVQKN